MSRFPLFSTVKVEMHTELSSRSGRMVQVQHTWDQVPGTLSTSSPSSNSLSPGWVEAVRMKGHFPCGRGCPVVLLLVLLSGPLGPGPSLQGGIDSEREIRVGGEGEREDLHCAWRSNDLFNKSTDPLTQNTLKPRPPKSWLSLPTAARIKHMETGPGGNRKMALILGWKRGKLAPQELCPPPT